MGNAYSNLSTGGRAENLKRAIACFEAAFRVYKEDEFPKSWATTQVNLGTAYSDLATGQSLRGQSESAGINRLGVGNERVLQ